MVELNYGAEVEYWKGVLDFLRGHVNFDDFLEVPKEHQFRAPMYEAFFTKSSMPEISVRTGATKGVFISDKRDWVIKIPFEDMSKNYCDVEADVFELAESITDFSDVLAESQWLFDYEYDIYGDVGTIPIYVMEKVACSDDLVFASAMESVRSASPEEMDEDEAYKLVANLDSEDMVSEILEGFYGEQVYYEIMEFFADNHVNDLHDGNIGFRGDQPVLVDYSGFWD